MFRKWSIILVFMLLNSTTSAFASESVYLDGYRFDSISMPQKIRKIIGEPRDGLILFESSDPKDSFDKKCGYLNEKFEIVIPPVYENAYPFSEGLAWVRNNSRLFGAIDRYGNEVIPPQYEEVSSFLNGVAIVRKDGKAGLIDKAGNKLIFFLYEQIRLDGNIIRLTKKDGQALKYGLCDLRGKMILSPEYDCIGEFSEGFAFIQKDGLYGYINRMGKLVFPMKYEYAEPFSEGLAYVEEQGQKYYINLQGEIVLFLTDEYERGGSFYSGLSVVKKDGLCGAVDTTGNLVVGFQYQELSRFYGNLAFVSQDGKRWGAIDKNNNLIIDYILIRDLYRFAYGFKGWESYTAVGEPYCYLGEDRIAVCVNYKWACIDTDGNWYTEPVYECFTFGGGTGGRISPGILPFHDGIAQVNMDSGAGRYTVIDKKGNVLCEPQDNIVEIMPHYFLTKKLWSYEFSLVERRNGETFLSLHDGILKNKNGKIIFGDLSFTPKRAVVGEEYNILNTKENVWLLKDLNYIYGIAFNKVPVPDTDFPSVCLCIDNPLLNRNEEITLLEKDNYFLTPVLYNERVLIPVCVLDDVLEDTQTSWDVESGTASVFRNGMTVQIWSDSFAALVDCNAVQTDVHAQVISGRVFIPLRFVAETLGFSVFWNDDTQTVTICDSYQTGLAF